MALPATATAPPASRRFASVLANLTAPPKFPPARDLQGTSAAGPATAGKAALTSPAALDSQAAFDGQPAFDGLEDDVATLTYEKALRGRSRPWLMETAQPSPHDPQPRQAANPELPPENTSPRPALPPSSAPKARLTSSVTIRLSAEENATLHARAAEAGLTLSAYLRSCAFEVDALRRDVKAAVAELRSQSPAAASKAPRDQAPAKRWRGLFLRFGRRA